MLLPQDFGDTLLVRGVGIGVQQHHGDRGDAHLAGGADDAHGDLASVGYQDLLQHG